MTRLFGVSLAVMSLSCRGAGESSGGEPRNGAPTPSGVPLAEATVAAVTAIVPVAPIEVTTRPPLQLAMVKDCVPPANPPFDTLRSQYDVVYSTPHGRQLGLDVAWPKTPGKHPLVVLIHGGAWIGGDREYHRNDILRLAGQGYVAATIDYRLAGNPKNAFPAALEDVRCAVRFLRKHADDYAIDPARVGALGDSAGGHLAAMLAVAGDLAGDGTCSIVDQPDDVQAAVVDYAPLDLRTFRRYPESIQLATKYLLGGKEPANHPDLTALASPATHVDEKDPPMLLLHGTNDRVVPFEESRDFARVLEKAHVPHLYVELPNIPHGFLVLGSGFILRKSTCTTMAFLAETLHP
ncbi:MAG: alpha/beta hydrolase [Polyangiales bacterium]